jgi:hypothetical protein
MGRINTTKMLRNDSFYTGGMESEGPLTGSIALHPFVCSQYDYSTTDDAELLQERKDTREKLYDIFKESPFFDIYTDPSTKLMKIPKEDISKVFYYMKEKLDQIKKLSAFEITISINEFFDFNYEWIVKHVLSSKMMSELYADYYNNGMASIIEENANNPLF